ncbi:DNA-3-methyladenine glycosylase I [Paenibacillus sp. FSL K6-1230]|uniref:DNA-3-methyladenine glycosylase I n=1 Tax=Paenibacillus sp. FSL K6-1230 TaxID=2921603 RepID=UPI0030F7BBA9
MSTEVQRCAWVNADPLYISYHDEEWGIPKYGDQELFELLILEGMQAGLSWYTVLKKREAFREAFDQFNPERIAAYDDEKIEQLMSNPGIIRNRLKIQSTITNARIYLEIMEEGSFSELLWSFTEGVPLVNHWRDVTEVPAVTPQSDQMSKTLRKRGMKFIGSTICYAFMQASGMVDDHTMDCFCRK